MVTIGRQMELNQQQFPVRSHSWTVESPDVAIKKMDKSSFLHHGTGIPRDIGFFFGANAEVQYESTGLRLLVDDESFTARIDVDVTHSRLRMFWDSALEGHIRDRFPAMHREFEIGSLPQDLPDMKFTRIESKVYELVFVEPESGHTQHILSGVLNLPDELDEDSSFLEGTRVRVYVNRYERDRAARKRCIEIHGTRCAACGLDFAERYGNLGAGFIHVHHLTPISEIGEQYVVDPARDLIPVCPNCHAMIHRRDPPLTLDELLDILYEQ